MPPEPGRARSHLPLFHHSPVAIQHTVTAESVPQVHPHSPIRPLLPLRFRFSATLLHWLVSFLDLECVADSSIARSARPAVSSHLKIMGARDGVEPPTPAFLGLYKKYF